MIFVVFLSLFVLFYLFTFSFGQWLRHETYFDHPADVAIVMGSAPFKALPRIQKAAQLYHQGLVKKLILSGKPLVGNLSEAQWLKQQAVFLGVSEDDLLLEEEATNCKENILFSKPIIVANQFASVVLILQEFSQVRVYLTAKKQLADLSLKLINQPASAAPYWDRWSWMFSGIGWRYTWKTVSRLIKYRYKGDL